LFLTLHAISIEVPKLVRRQKSVLLNRLVLPTGSIKRAGLKSFGRFFDESRPGSNRHSELRDLAFRKKAELFAGADKIIAPHGAASANIAFCQPGTRLVEVSTRSG
jgi:hypothetical protein